MLSRIKYIFVIIFLLSIADLPGQSKIWDKTISDPIIELARSIVEVNDTLYAVCYHTPNLPGEDGKDDADVLVIKMGPEGEIIWSESFGGNGDDDPYEILYAADGNLLVFGNTNSEDGIFSNNLGDSDGFVIKITPLGELIWATQLGGQNGDYLISASESAEGELYLAGFTDSYGSDMGHGLIDGWISKLSATGDLVWQNSYGGSYNDLLMDVSIFKDTSLIVCGRTRSNDKDVLNFKGSANNGFDNGWAAILDTSGMILHQHCFGNSDSVDVAFSRIHILKNGHILLGGEISKLNRDLTSDNYQLIVADYSGNLAFNDSYTSKSLGNYEMSEIVQDLNSNTFLIGSWGSLGEYSYLPFDFTNYYIVKLDQNLEEEWIYYSEAHKEYKIMDAVLDLKGDLITCGGRDIQQELPSYSTTAFVSKLCLGFENITEVFLCSGDSLEINSHFFSEQGVYFDTLSTTEGCDSIIAIHLNILPSFYFHSFYDGFCGNELSLHDSLISQSGEYSFSYLTEFNCDSVFDYEVELISPINQVIVDGNIITSLQPNATYQWVNCISGQAIPGASGQTYISSEPGEYKVRIDYQGCQIESECISATGTQSPENKIDVLKVFPNPVQSIITVSSGIYDIRMVHVIDILGSVRIEYNCFGNQVELDLSDLKSGLYLMQIETDHNTFHKRILKR